MADVFDASTSMMASPYASTSRHQLDDGESAMMPTLAQLLQETVRHAASGHSSSGSSLQGIKRVQQQQQQSSTGTSTSSAIASLPSLPNLSSPASRAYLSSLLAKDLPSLLREPDELKKQSEHLDADLANLCYRSTRDLLGVGESVDGVEDGFGHMQSTLDSLLNCTEQLSTSCSDFTTSISPILSSRSRLNLVRSHITSIEDILSIPRLVSTCVRGGWWTEAMELVHRARDLEQLLRPASPSTSAGKRKDLLSTVREEVEVEVRGLRVRIIEGLRSRGLKLPAAVRSVALLRKMTQSSQEASSTSGEMKTLAREASSSGPSSSLSEPELRLTLLTSRWDCLRSQLDQLEVSASASEDSGSTEDHVRYLKRWLEIWREVVGETVNIYSEIFLSQATAAPTSSPSPSPSLARGWQSADYLSQQLLPNASDAGTPASVPSRLHLIQPHPPLSIFLSQCLQSLRQLLATQLPRITAVSALASLQTQISYCATAFAKFGFDFRHLPNSLIVERVRQVTLDRLAAASSALEKDFQRVLTMSGSRNGRPRILLGALVAVDARSAILTLQEGDLPLADKDSITSQPPTFITLFPPLAKLLNAHASALNELRLFPLVALHAQIRHSQLEQLNACTAILQHFMSAFATATKAVQTSPNPDADFVKEQQDQGAVVRRIAIVFARTVVPWCRWALEEGVYPGLHSQQKHASSEMLENGLQDSLAALLEVAGIVAEPAKEESAKVLEATTNGHDVPGKAEEGGAEDAQPAVKADDSLTGKVEPAGSASSDGKKGAPDGDTQNTPNSDDTVVPAAVEHGNSA